MFISIVFFFKFFFICLSRLSKDWNLSSWTLRCSKLKLNFTVSTLRFSQPYHKNITIWIFASFLAYLLMRIRFQCILAFSIHNQNYQPLLQLHNPKHDFHLMQLFYMASKYWMSAERCASPEHQYMNLLGRSYKIWLDTSYYRLSTEFRSCLCISRVRLELPQLTKIL